MPFVYSTIPNLADSGATGAAIARTAVVLSAPEMYEKYVLGTVTTSAPERPLVNQTEHAVAA